ncbi:hypothetical protein PCC6311_0249 [Synechococcus elongatus PCC 6311]|nr:hypothetical protein M744_01820 [Synechococcus elongatus UTEX 2973]UOW70024.1 hypothetical protein PCC7943_0249 [Synechococcus elongatus PCC 7943]UOW72745.1 hypothetical protein PCC6311_0249 [Synechococcus elongatus PCC 6311]UOW75466.1 hypothetical protein PCC6301pg_0249 [Synechococcus elongatus PCC 6301]
MGLRLFSSCGYCTQQSDEIVGARTNQPQGRRLLTLSKFLYSSVLTDLQVARVDGSARLWQLMLERAVDPREPSGQIC